LISDFFVAIVDIRIRPCQIIATTESGRKQNEVFVQNGLAYYNEHELGVKIERKLGRFD